MALNVAYRMRGLTLSRLEEERIERQITSLERRIKNFPEPRLELDFNQQESPPVVRVGLRLVLGPAGQHLVSHEEGPSADVATKAAFDDVKRQLEKRLASQRGEASFGVPSRRLPTELRPAGQSEEEEEDDLTSEPTEEEETA